MAEVKSAGEKLAALLEAYGVGVRAGVITPCLQDENEFRKMLGLSAAPKEVEEDWRISGGVRRPVTLQRTDGVIPSYGPDNDGGMENAE